MIPYFKNVFFLIGLTLAIFGCGPLLAIIVLDGIGLWRGTDNPVGPGILFFLTCWPATIFLLLGIFTTRRGKLQKQITQSNSAETRVNVDASARPVLTAEQEAYVRSVGIGTGWGLIYFAFMGVASQFFRHLPANFYYPHSMRNGRRYAWEGRSWASFEEYKYKNSQIDSTALWVLAIGVPVLFFLLFL